MRISSYTQLQPYEVSGNYLNVYYNEQMHPPKELETEPFWTYDLCRAYCSDSYGELVVKLLRSRYSIDDEFAAINEGGARHAEFIAFRDQAKSLARGWTDR